MRVGYLLEVVRRLLREGTELESKVGSIGTADGRVKVVEEQAQAGTREAQLADAERELSLESLVREMETLGVLRDGASADSGQPTALQDTISLLPSMTKWSHLVEARGKAATPG